MLDIVAEISANPTHGLRNAAFINPCFVLLPGQNRCIIYLYVRLTLHPCVRYLECVTLSRLYTSALPSVLARFPEGACMRHCWESRIVTSLTSAVGGVTTFDPVQPSRTLSLSLGAVSNSDVGGHGFPLFSVSCSFDDLDFTDLLGSGNRLPTRRRIDGQRRLLKASPVTTETCCVRQKNNGKLCLVIFCGLRCSRRCCNSRGVSRKSK